MSKNVSSISANNLFHNTPLVSIGIPVYNSESSLERCLQSLTDQTEKRIELVISNNASTDRTGEIIDKFRDHDHRLKVYEQPHTISATENFDFVLKKSRGYYFMWGAGDDYWAPEYLEQLIALKPKNSFIIGKVSLVDRIGQNIPSIMDEKKLVFNNSAYLNRLNFITTPHIFGKANLIYSLGEKKLFLQNDFKLFNYPSGDVHYIYKTLGYSKYIQTKKTTMFKGLTSIDKFKIIYDAKTIYTLLNRSTLSLYLIGYWRLSNFFEKLALVTLSPLLLLNNFLAFIALSKFNRKFW